MSLVFLRRLVLMVMKQFREYLEANGYDTSQMGLIEETETVDEVRSSEEKKSSEEEKQDA